MKTVVDVQYLRLKWSFGPPGMVPGDEYVFVSTSMQPVMAGSLTGVGEESCILDRVKKVAHCEMFGFSGFEKLRL